MEKIVALSVVFDVTTDYLLKSSEIDDLSVKTEMLEKQQQNILIREQKQQQILSCIMYSIAVYMIFFAVYFIGHFHFWSWVANPSVFFAGFLIATAIVIFICAKKINNKEAFNIYIVMKRTGKGLYSFSCSFHHSHVLGK